MNVSAIILAGGNSSRMKYNKEFIKIGDEFLVHKQIKQLLTKFNEVIVVSNNPDHYQGQNVKVVSDILKGNTPIIGLHAGLIHSSNRYNYVIACDMAFINFDFINYLVSLTKGHEAYIAKYNNYIEPFNALYSKDIIPKIELFLKENNSGFQRLVKELNTHYISEPKVGFYQQKMDMFKNINNESDLYDDYTSITSNYINMDVKKVINFETFNVKDKVITEYPLTLYINNYYYSTMMITPDNIEFLVLGYLHSEFVIKDISEIIDIKLDIENHRCDIILNHKINTNNIQRLNIMSTACGNTSLVKINDEDLPIVPKKQTFNINHILDMVALFNKESILFKETGGVHSVELIYGDTKMLFEDIGRHNAIDKVVGYLLKNNIKSNNIYIITSGRISSDILLKAALINISLIVSRSAPT
ncbi:MAG: formate dehydrogenase accessory sulfurtransferase FdhD, partial [Candidatus Izimaplasma sp.]|nr:formate dehydrogenase accessory sulfurtransferase FdhD [Candidatus Izimaplasma bacterium]